MLSPVICAEASFAVLRTSSRLPSRDASRATPKCRKHAVRPSQRDILQEVRLSYSEEDVVTSPGSQGVNTPGALPNSLPSVGKAAEAPLLTVDSLRIYYHSVLGEYKVVDGASLSVRPGEIFGLAGESGSGKSTLVDGVLRLIKPPGYVAGGQVLFRPGDSLNVTDNLPEMVDLLALAEGDLRRVRWKHMSYVPQGSMNALNPVMRVRDQLTEGILAHTTMSAGEANAKAREVLELVGLGRRVERLYPHELSGGMKQRAVIACAIALRPKLVMADEPTTALDVNAQRAILQLIHDLRRELGITVLFVSHEMGVHAELVDRMAIMYAGEVVEIADVESIYIRPLHPYTQGLIGSIPHATGERKRLVGIPGMAPSALTWPEGCRFHPRCSRAMDI